MTKVELRMNENRKYEIIKKLVECNGNKKAAALKISCTPRTINRLIQGYDTNGKAFFIHGNRGKKPIHALSYDTISIQMQILHISPKSWLKMKVLKSRQVR